MIDTPGLSAAVVDISLGRGDCSAVCERLSRGGTPFVFYTGEARPDIVLRLPSALDQARGQGAPSRDCGRRAAVSFNGAPKRIKFRVRLLF